MITRSILLSLVICSMLPAATTSPAPIHPGPPVARAAPKAAAEALIGRVLGARAREFTVSIIPAADGKNVFEIESMPDGTIQLRGDNGVSIASALNHYLKYTARCHLSWCGDQLNLPAPAPAVAKMIRMVTPHRHRVMFNYCTLSYTCAFWDWPRWERELDFLAMNGVNTPLGVLGLEGVWYNTLVREGFSDTEARAFFVGPAYSAWQWMTNIEGHGGPLSRAFIEARVRLGQRWLGRAEELGMTPIRQGFSGYVPARLKETHPDLAIARQPSWCGFPGSCQLDPTDPYFRRIGTTFMEESLRLFGTTSHLWAADPFHESAPPKPGDQYLNAVGSTIHGLMKAHDPLAVWAMQSWDIRKPITDPVPKGDLLVLDLTGERGGFWGHDYIRGRLHNFGGRINLHGDIRTITTNPFAKTAMADPQCKGMGMFPEAIIQNPVFYDAVYDMIWRDQATPVDDWLANYTIRRYGVDSPAIRAAWQTLLDHGPYGHENPGQQEYSSMIAARPALVAKKSGPNLGFRIPYPQKEFIDAVAGLLAESARCAASDAYRFDMVDFTRQILSNHAQDLHARIRLAYLRKDAAAFQRDTARFHELLADTDTLLATRPEFLFGKWLADARKLGTSPEEAGLFARNAASLVTLWGPAPFTSPQATIFDYSWREWSGLISRYYLPRWQKFHTELGRSIATADYRDPPATNYGREGFDATPFYKDLARWEIAFANNPPDDLPATPSGDPVATAQRMLEKYRAEILADLAGAADRDAMIAALLRGPEDNSPVIGEWKPGLPADKFTTITIDVSRQVTDEGEHLVAFHYTKGVHALDIESVSLLVNGRSIATDKHAGRTGHVATNNTYKLATGGLVLNGKYELQAVVKPAGGSDSTGVIRMRKIR